MPLVAHSETMLAHFTDILHDLYFDWPEEKLSVKDGQFLLTLYDKDNLLDSNQTLAFRLSIQHIESLVVKGKPQILPKEEAFNKFVFKRRKNLLVMKNCLATEIHFTIRELHLELEQLP